MSGGFAMTWTFSSFLLLALALDAAISGLTRLATPWVSAGRAT